MIDRVEEINDRLPVSKSFRRSCASCDAGMLSRGKSFEYSAVASGTGSYTSCWSSRTNLDL